MTYHFYHAECYTVLRALARAIEELWTSSCQNE